MNNGNPSLWDKLNRSLELDALRGFAILTMLLSGQIPFGVLPSWMYHAQVPPPLHQFNPNLPGITWVDLVFPFFLFSLGSAIPFALSTRIENGVKIIKIIFSIFVRGFLLIGFAIFLQHTRANILSKQPTTSIWLITFLSFVLLFPVLTRFPFKMKPITNYFIKAIGLTFIIFLIYMLEYPDGTGFKAIRSDIIILVLANVSISASLIWLWTRENILMRLGILGFVLSARLIHTELDWGNYLWRASPIPWFGSLYFQQYLFIVIPGTIIGDLLLKFNKQKQNFLLKDEILNVNKYHFIFWLMLIFNIALLVGLKSRLVFETFLFSIGLALISWAFISKPIYEIDKKIKSIFQWGIYFLLLGLSLEPFEGGIKKDHPTMSYYFVTTGLACFLLIAFLLVIEIFKKQKFIQLLINNGQNPMIAYAGITNLILPLLALTGLGTILNSIFSTPWLGVLKALIIIFVLALIVNLFTKKKIFWRT